MRSIQDNEVGNRCVGSDINWCKPGIVVNESMPVPSGSFMPSAHCDLDVALKSPNITVKVGLKVL